MASEAGDIAFDVPLDFNMPAFDAEAPPLASQAVLDEPIEVLRQAFEKQMYSKRRLQAL